MTEMIVQARGVSVELGSAVILDDVGLTVGRGEIVAVVGENGAGKSTLLRCLAGLQPASGTVEVLGGAPSDEPRFWRQVALVGDEPAWYPGLTVLEHLEMIASVHDTPRMSPARALEVFGLTDRRDLAPLSMSTGQRQRLSLAMALLRPSRVLLMDEPERGLDAAFRASLASLLKDYAAEDGAVVMATHDPQLAEAAGARLITLETT